MIEVAGIIGDIHAEDVLLERALSFLHGRVDRILAVGDVIDGPGDVNRCCDLLRRHNVQTVRGNHERWLRNGEMRTLSDANCQADFSPENNQWLSTLPLDISFNTPTGAGLLCHGIGGNDMAMVLPDRLPINLLEIPELEKLLYESDITYIINGHSHIPLVRNIDRMTIINAGTLKKLQNPCFVVADFVQRTVQFFDLKNGEPEPEPVIDLPSPC